MQYLNIIKFVSLVILFTMSDELSAQFIDDFQSELEIDQSAKVGWAFRTGDGKAEINFSKKIGKSSAQIEIDATKDVNNIWWAIIRRNISEQIDIKQLTQDGYELRVEANVKPSHAPRRINLHFNTQRTTDYHSHLMEFDLSDTSNWHQISMTTSKFDAREGDDIYVQIAMMDWGLRKYALLVDYIKVDVVTKELFHSDLGTPQKYHPPIPKITSFRHYVNPVEDAVVSVKYHDQNYESLGNLNEEEVEPILEVDGNKISILRWDFSQYKESRIEGTSVLELSTKSLIKLNENVKDFGLLRISEIIRSSSEWTRNNVTLNSLLNGQQIESVINEQMIIDVEVNPKVNEKTIITISEVVMNRLLDGSSKGIALLPLGEIDAIFYSVFSEDETLKPKLYFNLVQ